MRPRTFLTATLCCVVMLAVAPGGVGSAPADPVVRATSARSPPNIVLISTDDMRAADLRYMPHTRRLIGRAGVTFDNALSNFPLCCPARATLLTGQYPHNHGVLGNEYPLGGHRKFHESRADLSTLPVWLARAGYRTSFVGKYLNYYGSTSPLQGSTRATYVPPGWRDWQGTARNVQRYTCTVVNENGVLRHYRGRYQTDLYGSMAVDAVRSAANSDRPLFLWVSHIAPHLGSAGTDARPCRKARNLPTPAAPRHKGMFTGLRLPASPATNEADMSDKGRYLRDRSLVDLGPQALRHQGRAQALQAVDESVADLVRALKDAGELRQTVIFFTSDNGWLFGEHRVTKKKWGYEESLRVPMLVRGRAFPEGAHRRQPVGLVDIPATALDLANASPTVGGERVRQDGVSLLGIARDRAFLAERVMPIEAARAGAIQRQVVRPVPHWFYRGVRTSRYSFISYDMGTEAPREEELYDLARDPYQLHGEPSRQRPQLVQALRSVSADLEDCAGRACVQELPDLRVSGSLRRGDASGVPSVRILSRPRGWIRTTRSALRYRASDPDGGRLHYWCSEHVTGCNRFGSVQFRFRGQGRQYWSLFVGDGENQLTSRVGTVKVDLRPPSVSRKSKRYDVVGGPTTLSWRLTDGRSGIRSMDARRQSKPIGGTFGRWSSPDSWLRQRDNSVRIRPRRGTVVCVEVRARDVAGWHSPWAGRTCRERPR